MPLQMVPRVLGDVTIVTCRGRLVLGEESADLRNFVKSVLTESKKVVLDLGGVSFIDSSGLGVLAGLFTSARNAGGAIKLSSLDRQAQGMLQMTRLLTVFEVFGRAEDAAASFNRAAGQSAPAEW
jgi:anti-sigma B factor antagonist